MGIKIKVWLDSGANIHSCREQIIDLDDFCLTEEEWDSMSGDEKDDMMREVAWDRMEWGYHKVEESGE